MFTYTVSELCQHCKGLLENEFPDIWVKGEISNLARPASGHIYFSLKDDNAQIRCALFRFQAARMKFQPEEGDEVLAHGKLSLYTNRGDFQMICDNMEPVGIGALQKAYEQLRDKLQKEGLFEPARKKTLPRYPRRIGVITSSSGAAVRDIFKTLERRFPAIPIILYPSLVQGEEAPQQLIQALKTAQQRKECDVLLLARGGGSIEDLWAFNDETLAREVAHCEIPVISGVGHENDVTIVDYVADVRASTPTAAAEAATPDSNDVRITLDRLMQQFTAPLQNRLQQDSLRLNNLHKRFSIPKLYFSSFYQLLEKFQQKLLNEQKYTMFRLGEKLNQTEHRLRQNSSEELLLQTRHTIQSLQERLTHSTQRKLDEKRFKLDFLAKQSHSLSPMPTLNRGYSIVTKAGSRKSIQSISEIEIGDIINSTIRDGMIISTVTEKLDK